MVDLDRQVLNLVVFFIVYPQVCGGFPHKNLVAYLLSIYFIFDILFELVRIS